MEKNETERQSCRERDDNHFVPDRSCQLPIADFHKSTAQISTHLIQFSFGDLRPPPSPPSMALNQEDFRKILATPRSESGTAPSLLPPNRRPGGSKLNPFKKPIARIRREGRSDALDKSHVDLGTGFVDRAKERRLAELSGQQEKSGEIKGLDFELLKKVRSGEFVLPKIEVPVPGPPGDESDEEEDGEEEAILDELLAMEVEIKKELEEEEQRKKEKARKRVEEVTKQHSPEKEEDATEGKGEVQKSRFKPIVDAKQLKQMRKEQKRRKLAMQAMDRISKPQVSMAPPPALTQSTKTTQRKSRAQLLEQLRRIQAAKKETSEVIEARPMSTSEPTETSSATISMAPPIPPVTTKSPEPEISPEAIPEPAGKELISPQRSPSHPPRKPSPPPIKIQVGENMFSDESDLSDYNPYGDNSDDDSADQETKAPAAKEPSPPALSTGKRNYFGDKDTKEAVQASHPITMDPVVAAALRKAAALTEKSKAPHSAETEVKEKKKSNVMSLGGVDGVYEFDDGVDTWEGELDEEEDIGPSRKRKRKEK